MKNAYPPFDFTLTGCDKQDSFDIDKYVSLALGNPNGLKLSEKVEDHWAGWVDTVEQAGWFKYWKRSKCSTDHSATPTGRPFEWDSDAAGVALAVYVAAVWGFGVDHWLRPGSYGITSKLLSPAPNRTQQLRNMMSTISRLQGRKRVDKLRRFSIDDKLFRGCALEIPAEFGTLDRWLQSYWSTIVQ